MPLSASLHRRAPRRVALPLVALVVGAPPLAAQREQLALRIEQFAESRATPAGLEALAPTIGLRQVTLTAGVRTVTGRDDNTVLVNGGFYRRSDLDLRVRGGSSLTTVHALYYDFLALRTLDDRHTVAVALRPGLFGDLAGDLGEQFRLEGAVFVDRVLSPRTTIGAGLSYTSGFGRVLPIPVVHLVHRRGRRVLVDGLLPARLDVWWFPRKGVELGVNAQLSGFQYAIGEYTPPRAPARPPASGAGPLPTGLELANAIVGPQARWNPAGRWWLSLDAGWAVVRRATFTSGPVEGAWAPAGAGVLRLGVQRQY
jgi:hypothetical protein